MKIPTIDMAATGRNIADLRKQGLDYLEVAFSLAGV